MTNIIFIFDKTMLNTKDFTLITGKITKDAYIEVFPDKKGKVLIIEMSTMKKFTDPVSGEFKTTYKNYIVKQYMNIKKKEKRTEYLKKGNSLQCMGDLEAVPYEYQDELKVKYVLKAELITML